MRRAATQEVMYHLTCQNVVDILRTYSNRPDLRDDLERLARRLTKALAEPLRVIQRRRVAVPIRVLTSVNTQPYACPE